ncbi:MAG: hypothetical protein V7677_15540, partial [Motiliproteus sp.]
MSRQEEFNDIPDLGPASDDLDGNNIPTLKPLSEVAAASSHSEPKKSANGLLYSLVLVLMMAVAGGGFWAFQKFEQLGKELANAERTLVTAQGRLTDIESLVSATDDSVNKSGAALQAQLKQQINDGQNRIKLVDSEVAKLWAIYQKYKPKMETIEQQQSVQVKQLASQKAELKTVGQSLDTIGLSLDEQTKQVGLAQKNFSKVDGQLKALDKSLQAAQRKSIAESRKVAEQVKMQDLANQEIDDLQAIQLDEVQAKLNALKSNPQVPAQLN